MTTQYKTISKQKQELITFIRFFQGVEYGVCEPCFTIACPNKVVADTLAKAISTMGYIIKDHAQEGMFMVQLVEPTITIDALKQAAQAYESEYANHDNEAVFRFLAYLGIEE